MRQVLFALALVLFSAGYIPFQFGKDQKQVFPPTTNNAKATYQFFPVGGALITGSSAPILGLTPAAAEGVNVGDWRGTLAADSLHWGFAATTTGFNAYLDLGNVRLNGANKIIFQTTFDLDATAPTTFVQVCDWVSSVGVSNAADAQCSGGGWRNLNLNDAGITTVTPTAYDWEIYDGYWHSSTTTKISTPLSNFVSGANTVRVRYYSTTNTNSLVNIDYLRMLAVVNPVYSASGATQISGGAMLGDYSLATIGGAGQTGADGVYFRIPGTAGTISNSYLSYTGVHTYSGANTILARSTYSCSATGINIRPKIFNFTSNLWEDLTTGSIACAVATSTNAWAKVSQNIGNYISGGEVRIGWYGLAVGTQEIRLDMQYIMIGTTSTGGANAITFGTLSAGTVASTTNLDMTGTTNTWNITAVAKSNTQAFFSYAYDGDNSVTAGRVTAANIDFAVAAPAGTVVAGEFFAGRFASTNATAVVAIGLEDYSGLTSVLGGWSPVGATAATALTYTDNISVGSVLSGGAAGWNTNPEDFIDTVGGRMNMRLRTSTVVNAAFVSQWDFAMVSLQWVEDPVRPSTSYQFDPSGGALVNGTAANVLNLTAPAATGVNVGDWKGTEAADLLHWGFNSTTTGYNAYIDLGGVQLNGANKIIFQTTLKEIATAPATLVQVCDWVSSVGVNNPADAQCSGGGWRTLNVGGATIAPVAATAYDWEIYDGYWNANATTKISTPLSNFASSSKIMRVRYYSTTNTTSIVNIDFLRAYAVVDPIYSASGATQINGGTMTGSYASTTLGGAGQTGIDASYFIVPGVGTTLISDFYLSYTGVRTYPGVNTILVNSTYSCSATGPTMTPKIYNFTTTLWENLTATPIPCAVASATSQWAKSNIATIGDYVSGGEIRIGWYAGSASAVGLRIDMQYVMIGTTNTSGVGEVSFGTNNAGTVANTQTIDTTAASTTWSLLAAAKSNTQAFASYAYDGNNIAGAGFAAAANIDFSLTPPSNSYVTGLFYAARFMAGTAGGTAQIGLRDYSGMSNTMGGWTTVGSNSTTALTYTDNISSPSGVLSGGAAGFATNPQSHIDSVGGEMNMRLRTTTTSAAQQTTLWDFAMVSLQWVDMAAVPQSLTFSISTSTVGFGSIDSLAPHFATADGLGTSTETVAHTITASSNSPGGYVISMDGGTLTSGASSIAPIGAVNTALATGTDQYGVRFTAAGGFGVVNAPYAASGFAFDTATFPDVIAVNPTNDSTPTVYSARYLVNMPSTKAAGGYTSTMSYVVSATF